MLEHLWTQADSEMLDEFAIAHFTAPLRPDPLLWEVFAQDRAEAPYVAASRPGARITGGYKPRPTNCRGCRVALVSRYDNDVPQGAVLHRGRGFCNRCYMQVRRAEKRRYA